MNIRTLCLGILTFSEASGYEIKKQVEDGAFAHFIDASYGSIYPALTKMLTEGLVSVRAEEQAGKPDKKVYAITEKGRRELAVSLAVDPAKDKFKSEFLFQMLLCEYLPKSHIADIYQAQLDFLRAELEKINCCVDDLSSQPALADHPGMNIVRGYGRASIEAGLRYLEENKDTILGVKAPELKIIEN